MHSVRRVAIGYLAREAVVYNSGLPGRVAGGGLVSGWSLQAN